MTQTNLPVMTSPTSGAQLVSNLEDWRDALHSMHSGTVRPSYVLPQMMWIDTSTTPWVLKVFQGSDDIIMGTLDPTTLDFTPSSLSVAYSAFPIGIPFQIIHSSLIPSNAGQSKFIILSAGQTDPGGYNEGLITQSVSGSFPTNTAVGTISVGPLTGATIELVNTTQRSLRGGTSFNEVENDQIQNITGTIENFVGFSTGGSSGALSRTITTPYTTAGASTSGSVITIGFNASTSPNARTGTYTRPRGWANPYYMKIVQ